MTKNPEKAAYWFSSSEPIESLIKKPIYEHCSDLQIDIQEEYLQIAQVRFKEIDGVIWQWPELVEVSGINDQGDYIILADLKSNQLLEHLKAVQKRFPNHQLISKCLALASLDHAESMTIHDIKLAMLKFNYAVDALERVLEQDENDAEANMALMIAYCYLEDLETDEDSTDYPELLNELLYDTNEELLPLMATACEQRGRDFFQKQQLTLGFTFLKQALFIQRQRNLLKPDDKSIWKRMLATGTVLISLTSAAGWEGIADQIRGQVALWYQESADNFKS